MLLQLEILDGSMRGEQFSFELTEGQEVRIGRDARACEVALTEEYVRVSRRHCALRVVLGGIRIRTNKTNAVVVNKAPLFDDAVLESGTIMRLGDGGPRVRVSVKQRRASDRLASTIIIKPRTAAPLQQLREQAVAVQGELKAVRRRSWVAGGLVATLAVVGVWIGVQARAEAASLKQGALDAEQADMVVAMIKDRAAAPPELAEVTAQVARSVYCVMRTRPSGVEAVGTAWVVDREKGLLATNAHVAEEFEEGQTIVRPRGAKSADLRVESVRAHPAYATFGRQLARYFQAVGTTSSNPSQRAMQGFDVALLVIVPEDRAALAPDLALLGHEQAMRLSAGSPCATIGFPAEGVGFNPKQPEHKTHLGNVVALTDYFLAAGEPADAQLIHTSMPVAGGQSGSPVVDQRGRVLGLISSANVVYSRDGRRIPLAGTTYAQRVDTLQELLAGRADAANRESKWQTEFDAAVGNAKKTVEQQVTDEFIELLSRDGVPGKVEVVTRKQVELNWDEDAGVSLASLDLDAPASGRYLCCVIADELVDIDLVAWLPDGSRMSNKLPDWYPTVVFNLQESERVKLATFCGGERSTGAMVVVLRDGR